MVGCERPFGLAISFGWDLFLFFRTHSATF